MTYRKRLALTAAWAVFMWLPFALNHVSCTAFKHEQAQPCPPSQLAAIEAAYVSETVIACKLEGAHSRAECKAYPALRDKYQAQRAAYVECAK